MLKKLLFSSLVLSSLFLGQSAITAAEEAIPANTPNGADKLTTANTLKTDSNTDYTILSGIESRTVFDQCARMTPMFRTSYRDLDEATVNKIESKLIDQLKDTAKSKNLGDIDFKNYQRQYVAYEMLRRELIYINGFHKNAEKTALDAVSKKRLTTDDWKGKAINSCNAGSEYWGVIYDPVEMVVLEFLFNTGTKRK